MVEMSATLAPSGAAALASASRVRSPSMVLIIR